MSARGRTGISLYFFFFFFQAEDGIRDYKVTGVQTCALPISEPRQRIGERLRHARAVGLLAEKQAVQVGVEEAGEAPAQQLRGREVHLVARDEVDVQRVQVRDEGPELRPGPGRHAAHHLLAAALELVRSEEHTSELQSPCN